MGRVEMPVDPKMGPLQQFAHDLQVLRRQAGEPTYRSMSRQAGISHSVLSEAAKGHRLPTLQVTRAFVRACSASAVVERQWHERWEHVRSEISGNHRIPRGPATCGEPAVIASQAGSLQDRTPPENDEAPDAGGPAPPMSYPAPRPVRYGTPGAYVLIGAAMGATAVAVARTLLSKPRPAVILIFTHEPPRMRTLAKDRGKSSDPS